jgi:hypothetical protein
MTTAEAIEMVVIEGLISSTFAIRIVLSRILKGSVTRGSNTGARAKMGIRSGIDSRN